jgi:pimeloyl-ACP methyl ester carboxylesterase/DNA-binding XRE family transcriptional regulator
MAHQRPGRPYWSQVLRALREARGITQDGWAMQIGYGRATVKRWEAGETVPSADAETKIIALCHERALFRPFKDGPLAGVRVTPDWLADLLASARLEHSRQQEHASAAQRLSTVPETRYAMSGDVAIAYQVFGEGSVDLVLTPGLVSHRELEWEHPLFASFLREMATIGRVAIFDKRGTGMSDRVPAGTLEERMDDIRAVMDAAGMEQAVLVGISEGGPLSILFAATHPERTRSLVLYGAFACDCDPDESPPGKPSPPSSEQIARIRETWGKNGDRYLSVFAPVVADDPDEQRWWARYLQNGASPGAAVALMTMNAEIDVRHVLPAVRVPSMVLHRRGDLATDVRHGQYLARHIPGALYVELEGDCHLPLYGDTGRIVREIKQFVDSVQSPQIIDTMLTTVVTIQVDVAGFRCANEESILVDELFRRVHQTIAGSGGRLAAQSETSRTICFHGPSRAVDLALEVVSTASSQGIAASAGVHTGEVQRQGEIIFGAPITISEHIANSAGNGQVLVSRTVADLVPGSGFQFEEHGTYAEDGLQQQLPIYRAVKH